MTATIRSTVLKRFIWLICSTVLFFCGPSHATNIPKGDPVPGGIALVKFLDSAITPPTVFFNDKQVMVVTDPDSSEHWIAVVGIPLDTEAGQHQLQIRHAGSMSEKPFEVKKHKYKSQYITLKNKRKVNPYKKDLERIKKKKNSLSPHCNIGVILQVWRNPLSCR